MTDIERLTRAALSFALDNPHSDFYRRKYGANAAALLNAPIEDIPFLGRAEIDAAPVLERVFVPKEMIRFIRSTSGSSGRGVVGMPMVEDGMLEEHLAQLGHRKESGQRSRYFEPYFSAMNIRSVLLFSAGAFVHEMRLRLLEGRDLISGEFAEPRLTARLAHEAGVEAMIGNPSGLLDFAPYLVAEGGAQRMRLIISVGERPTSLQFSRLAELFPNAKVALQYGLIEAQGYLGYSCPERLSVDPKALHLASGTFSMELVDPETGVSLPLGAGVEGEIVVTSHEPQAFPLIRYRTGDLARIRDERCSCAGEPFLFECLGRAALDRVRVPRGILTIAAIDEGLASLRVGAQEFEASWQPEGELPGLSVVVYMEETASLPEPKALARAIRVAPDVTYQDIVEQGLAMPLSLRTREPEPWVGWRKKKRLS